MVIRGRLPQMEVEDGPRAMNILQVGPLDGHDSLLFYVLLKFQIEVSPNKS